MDKEVVVFGTRSWSLSPLDVAFGSDVVLGGEELSGRLVVLWADNRWNEFALVFLVEVPGATLLDALGGLSELWRTLHAGGVELWRKEVDLIVLDPRFDDIDCDLWGISLIRS